MFFVVGHPVYFYLTKLPDHRSDKNLIEESEPFTDINYK